jgi:hypothetical protein
MRADIRQDIAANQLEAKNAAVETRGFIQIADLNNQMGYAGKIKG